MYEHRLDGDPYPYRYGSYQVFRANRIANLYQIGVFINVTSQDVSALYSQYMYTAILRAATDTPDLEFNIVSRPFPIYQEFKDQEEASRATDFTFMVAIALALVPCVMI